MDRRRRLWWGFAGLTVLLAVLLTGVIRKHERPARAGGPPPTPVFAAQASIRDVPLSVTALGTVQPWQGVLIRAQVTGILKRAPFAEGTDVAKGQLLAEIDEALYRAALKQAQGTLIRDRALLADARLDLARYRTLAAQDSIARQQVDTQAALVRQDEGIVRADEGAVDTARTNLDYCRILSPVDGRVGVRLVDPGNLVSPSDTTGLLIVNQIVPIAVTFTVPQGDFQRLSDVSDAFSRPMGVQAYSQETSAPLGQGEVRIADNHVDPATGTVELKARFPNAGKRLWPGQFVNVRLVLQTLQNATVIPSGAVNHGPKGSFAYVVGPARKVVMRPITVATTQEGIAVIKAGVRPGEMVVTDGQLSLKPGMAVAIQSPPAAAAKAPAS